LKSANLGTVFLRKLKCVPLVAAGFIILNQLIINYLCLIWRVSFEKTAVSSFLRVKRIFIAKNPTMPPDSLHFMQFADIFLNKSKKKGIWRKFFVQIPVFIAEWIVLGV
jgi:hypothetical protein